MEKLVVRHFLYPSAPPLTLNFSDQFAFRPSGSTTAALTNIFHTVTQLLKNYHYVAVIALDFTKAFDTIAAMLNVAKICPDLNRLVDQLLLIATSLKLFSNGKALG